MAYASLHLYSASRPELFFFILGMHQYAALTLRRHWCERNGWRWLKGLAQVTLARLGFGTARAGIASEATTVHASTPLILSQELTAEAYSCPGPSYLPAPILRTDLYSQAGALPQQVVAAAPFAGKTHASVTDTQTQPQPKLPRLNRQA
jgi:hypothetical protein